MKRVPTNTDGERLSAVAKAVQSAIDRILNDQEKLTAAKVSELVKLIQIQGDLFPERPQEINVRWIETWESKASKDE